MFRKILITILGTIFFLSSGSVFAGIRCGNDIISIGNTKILVTNKIQSCGRILDKDTYTKEISDSSGGEGIRIDFWSVRIKERGGHYCYPLTFEDGILTTIGSWSRCDWYKKAMFPLMVEIALTKYSITTLMICLGAAQVNAAIQDNFVNIS